MDTANLVDFFVCSTNFVNNLTCFYCGGGLSD